MTLPAGAACRGHDPGLWFPKTFHPELNPTARAVAICQACPIRADCLDFALSLDPPAVGIWGGRWLGNGERKGTAPAVKALCRQMARSGADAATIARTLPLSFKRVEMALRPHDGP